MVVEMEDKKKNKKWYMKWCSIVGPAKGKTEFNTKKDAENFAELMNEQYGSDFRHWVDSEESI